MGVLKAKVGGAWVPVGVPIPGAVFETATYTPTLANMAIGTGGSAQNAARYVYVGGPQSGNYGIMLLRGEIIFGTSGATFPSAGSETMTMPPGFLVNFSNTVQPLGSVLYNGVNNSSGVMWGASATTLRFVNQAVSGTQVIMNDLTATIPFAWAAGHSINYTAYLTVTKA